MAREYVTIPKEMYLWAIEEQDTELMSSLEPIQMLLCILRMKKSLQLNNLKALRLLYTYRWHF